MFGFVLPLLLLLAAWHKVIRIEISKHNMIIGEIFVRDGDIVRYPLICKEHEYQGKYSVYISVSYLFPRYRRECLFPFHMIFSS